MLALFQEYDIKGTLSGKRRIYGPDGVPVDALGYMLQRLGYQGQGRELCRDPEGHLICAYRASQRELSMNSNSLWEFYTEIDREDSTNASIKAKFHSLTGIPEDILQ